MLLVLFALKLVYAPHFRIDTDELQHLHVVWGWVSGHLPYRDFFDNHGPIFHLLCAPLFRALGERADIIIPMRLAMIPLWAVSLWSLYRIGTVLFSSQVGIWAVLIAGFYPEFFLTSTEFRTDNLWTALWLGSLAVAVGGPFTAKRALWMGLLLGTAFGVTVKTGLMVGSVSLAAASVILWRWKAGQAIDWVRMLKIFATGLAGFAIVPSALTLFFMSQGALKDFLYCNITHNLVPHTQNWGNLDAHLLWFPVFGLLAAVSLFLFKPAEMSRVVLQRTFLALTTVFYFSALKTFFPTLSRQDDLPIIPLIALFVAALVLTPAVWPAARWREVMGKLLPPLFIAIETAALIVTTPFWRNDTREEIENLSDALRASRASDFVMDATGETIFRMRPYYYALEAFTKVRMQRGLIPDDIAEQLAATQTAFVRPRGLTRPTRKFVDENYISVGKDLCILGKVLKHGSGGNSRDAVEFTIPVPGRFVLVDKRGKLVSGKIDGTPFSGDFMLTEGPHSLVRQGTDESRVALFWADAFERGFSPFR